MCHSLLRSLRANCACQWHKRLDTTHRYCRHNSSNRLLLLPSLILFRESHYESMALTSTLQFMLLRYHLQIDTSLRTVIAKATERTSTRALDAFYGQIQYQLGWVDASFAPTQSNTGKLLRPTLVLLAFEVAGAWGQFPTDSSDTSYLERALPAAIAVE